ncbi:MAG: hypothetical protein JHC33_13730 [Ignisphaera sp.]|nr:hypothetical protein [Ignisphaera sp.]
MARPLIESLSVLDALATTLQEFEARLTYVDLADFSSKYYVVVHNILFPAALLSETPLTLKIFLEPVASIYIQESKVFVQVRGSGIEDTMTGLGAIRLPVVNVNENERLLILASVCIAERITLVPSEKALLKLLPGGLRSYVDAAYTMLKEFKKEKLLKIAEEPPTQQRRIFEFLLRVAKEPEDMIREVLYTSGITMKSLEIKYPSFSIEFKSNTKKGFAEAISFAERTLPRDVLDEIERNIIRTQRIVAVTKAIM